MLNATARARELRDAGVSFDVAAKTLTAEGYPTPKGGPWHGSTVFRLLQPPKPPGPGRVYKPHTEESKRKMSESHKRAFANGRPPPRGQANKTHCPQGHPYDETNTYHLPGGGRGCKECMREHTRKRRRRQGKAERPPSRTPESVRRRNVARITHEPLVYYAVRDGLVKVGTTVHFRKRMQDLRAEEILAVEPGGRDLEQARHAEFAEYQVIHPDRKGKRGGQNEWFRPGERLIAHATALRSVYSVPDFSKRQRHGPYILDPEAAAILVLLPPPLIPLRPGTLERFVLKITVDGECWRRTASLDDKGYGHFSLEGVQQGSHRASHVMFVGTIPDGYEVDHVKARGCRFKDCVRPAHLEAVTGHVNILRGGNMAAIHARATHCPAGHEYTPENTYIIQRKGGRTARQCKICTKANRTRRAPGPKERRAGGRRTPPSAETRALLSQKNTGYKHTPEAIEKIRAAALNPSDEARAKMAAGGRKANSARGGQPMPAAQRAKISATLKANPSRPGGNPDLGKTRAAQQRAKTHCPHGHEFTADNIYWRGPPENRTRQCKTCTRERAAARHQAQREAAALLPKPPSRRGGARPGTGDPEFGRRRGAQQLAKTHCPAGHEYSEENTYIVKRAGGRTARQCKICTKAKAAASAAAKRRVA